MSEFKDTDFIIRNTDIDEDIEIQGLSKNNNNKKTHMPNQLDLSEIGKSCLNDLFMVTALTSIS